MSLCSFAALHSGVAPAYMARHQSSACLMSPLPHCCRGKTNFFEKRVGDYQKSGVMAGLSGGNSSHAISFNEDF